MHIHGCAHLLCGLMVNQPGTSAPPRFWSDTFPRSTVPLIVSDLSPLNLRFLFPPFCCPLLSPTGSLFSVFGFHYSMIFSDSFFVLLFMTKIGDCEIRQEESQVPREHERGPRPCGDNAHQALYSKLLYKAERCAQVPSDACRLMAKCVIEK